MATKKWFVVEDDNEVGPLGPNGLRRLVREGRVRPDTLVRREDHQFLVRADHVRGLIDDAPPPPRLRRADPRPMIHGPYTSLRGLAWTTVAAMAVWIGIAVVGALAALRQRDAATTIAGDSAADVPLLGLGGAPFAGLFVATGVLFVYWLWAARVNVPHLIHARVHFGRSWTIGAWLVPPLNLWRPFEVIDEIDRLSAEAAADGDATVEANRGLLVPWWLCTVAVLAIGTRYEWMAHDTVDAVTEAAHWHLGAAVMLALAAALAAGVVLRISFAQERAHLAHAEPVPLQHLHTRGARRQATAIG